MAEQFPGEVFYDVAEGNSTTSCKDGLRAKAGWDTNTVWKHVGSDSFLQSVVV